jgi:hypothetical protein
MPMMRMIEGPPIVSPARAGRPQLGRRALVATEGFPAF